eukprot:7382597-Prymnesium_polylepis.1
MRADTAAVAAATAAMREDFTNLMGALREQEQVGDARRTAEAAAAAAADTSSLLPKFTAVLEGSASTADQAIAALHAQLKAQSKEQNERLQEVIRDLKADQDAALGEMRAGRDTGGGEPAHVGVKTVPARESKRPFSSATPTPRVPKLPDPDDDDEYAGVHLGDSRLPGLSVPPTGSHVLIFLLAWQTAWRKAKAWILRLVSTWGIRGRICWRRRHDGIWTCAWPY